MKNKAFALYLWLILFTTFVSFFSIIIFNYVSGDIRVTKKLIDSSKYYQNIRNLAVIATELYREGRGIYINGEFNAEITLYGKRYSFFVVRISLKNILIKIYEADKLIARVIVSDREMVNSIPIFFKNTLSNRQIYEISNVNVNAIVTTYDGNINVDSFEEKMDYAYISYDTRINNKGVIVVGNDKNKFYKYENLEELSKYSNYVGFISMDVKFLFDACKSAVNKVENKSYNSKTFQNEIVDLTKYGSLYIYDPVNYQNKKVRLEFNTTNSNQLISININDNRGNNLERYNYYLVREPMNIQITPNSSFTVTNDQNIADLINSNENSNRVNISLNPTYPYVYKVLQKAAENNDNPMITTIYKTRYVDTVIYSNIDLIVGSLEPNNFDGGTINNSIVIFTRNINVIGNIVYNEFGSIDDFINFADNNTFSFPSNSRSYFSVIANNININTNNFTDNYMVLNGDYVAFYDTNSTISLSGYNFRKLYYFGSTCSYKRYLPRNEKIVTDYRDGSNLIKASFNKCKILSVEIVK